MGSLRMNKKQNACSVINSMRKRIYVFPVTRWFYHKGFFLFIGPNVHG